MLSTILRRITVPIVPLALVAAVAAQTPPDPRGLLEQAQKATQQVEGLSYDFLYQGHGSMAGTFTGRVRLAKAKVPTGGYLWISMQVPEKVGDEKTYRLTIGTDGQTIQAIDERRRTFSHGFQGARHLLTYAYYGVLLQFLQPNPFAPELSGSTLELAGSEQVNGVGCTIVKATNNSFGGADVWWSLGNHDRLPHAQKWEVTTPGVTGGFRFTLSNLKTGLSLKAEDFQLTPPAGFRTVNEDERKVELGAEAPDWRLSTPEGAAIRLSQLKGRVVVLDFWASWCPPCWRLMPLFDKIAKDYSDKPVSFFGVNAWESPEVSPAAYLKERNVEYPILLHGESIAGDYKIGFLPAVFVLDTAGRIVYLENPASGIPETIAEQLQAAIEKALGQGG